METTIITLAQLIALAPDALLALAQQLHAAVRALAGVCDGALKKDDVGFSAADTSYGRAIAAVPPEQWTAEDVASVSALCRIYQGQLAGFGVDVDALPRVAVDRQASHAAFKARVEAAEREAACASYVASAGTFSDRAVIRRTNRDHAWVEGQEMVIQSQYDVDLSAAIKALNGRRWDGLNKVWRVQLRANAAVLGALLDKFEILCPAVARALLAAHAADATTAQAAPQPDHVTVADGHLVLRTPYSPDATAAIKAINGRRWDGERKVWRVPVTAESVAAVVALAGRFQWRVAAAVEAAGQAAVARAAENVVASKALSAETPLVGLKPGMAPYPFQRAGVAYCVANRRVLLADEMGIGKSLQSMLSIEQLGAYPCLVVAPKVVRRQWVREVAKFMAARTATECNGKLDLAGDFVIINYDILAKHLEALKAHGFRSLIVDESAMIKQKKAARSKAVKALAGQPGLEAVLLLSGTPILNRPVELVHQLDVLGRLREFGGAMEFMKRFCNAHQTRFGWDMTGASHLDELNTKLRARCMVRREKRDVLPELPALQRTVVPCEVADKGAFARAMRDAIGWLRAAKGTISEASLRAEALVRINALRQMAASFKYDSALAWLTNWLEAAEGQKLVVFAHHRDIQLRLAADLPGAVSISGDDGEAARAAAVDKFWHDPACRVIVCSLKAASVGLNLQCASAVSFVEFGWHPGDMDQAEGRVHRIGSAAAAINSYWLAGENTFDGDMIDLIEGKRAVATAAIVGGEGAAAEAGIVEWFAGLAAKFGMVD